VHRLTALGGGLHLPLRVRLTLAFVVATAILLGAVGSYIFLEVKTGLDSSLDASLRARAGEYARLAAQPSLAPLRRALAVEGEPAQLVSPQGAVLVSSPRGRGRPLAAGQRLRQARVHEIRYERHEAARYLGRPAAQGRAILVSTSMVQRERALTQLGRLLLIAGPLILLSASTAGYLVAAGALRPVERMRSRAAEISAATSDARLPLPRTRDELGRLGETLNEMLERLEATARHERAFLSNASHELRTPLAILRTEVDLALAADATPADQRAALESIGEEADRLVKLSEDLLVVARGRDASLPLTLEPTDLSDVVGNLVERFAVGGNAVHYEDTDASIVVPIDRLRLEQALGNLIDNALRHGAPPVTLNIETAERDVRIHVTDHGSGFHTPLTDGALEGLQGGSAGGFGLGLPIVSSIARAHGGHLEARETDGGTDVWISLPYRPDTGGTTTMARGS
jgi:signal transduction histidine kinase